MTGLASRFKRSNDSNLGVLERDQKSVQLVLKRRDNFDTFQAGNNPMKAMFSDEIKPSNGRNMHRLFLGHRLTKETRVSTVLNASNS